LESYEFSDKARVWLLETGDKVAESYLAKAPSEEACFRTWLERVNPQALTDSDAPLAFLRQVFAREWRLEWARVTDEAEHSALRGLLRDYSHALDFRREITQVKIDGVLHWEADSTWTRPATDSYRMLHYLDASGLFANPVTEAELESVRRPFFWPLIRGKQQG
jgi:hypothetical protein